MKEVLFSDKGRVSQTKTYTTLFVLTLVASIVCALCGVIQVVMLKEIGFILLGALGLFLGKRTIDGKNGKSIDTDK